MATTTVIFTEKNTGQFIGDVSPEAVAVQCYALLYILRLQGWNGPYWWESRWIVPSSPLSCYPLIMLTCLLAILQLSWYTSILLPCYPTILQSCFPVIKLSCCLAALLSCHPAILISCYPAIQLSCYFFVIQLSFDSAPPLSCYCEIPISCILLSCSPTILLPCHCRVPMYCIIQSPLCKKEWMAVQVAMLPVWLITDFFLSFLLALFSCLFWAC